MAEVRQALSCSAQACSGVAPLLSPAKLSLSPTRPALLCCECWGLVLHRRGGLYSPLGPRSLPCSLPPGIAGTSPTKDSLPIFGVFLESAPKSISGPKHGFKVLRDMRAHFTQSPTPPPQSPVASGTSYRKPFWISSAPRKKVGPCPPGSPAPRPLGSSSTIAFSSLRGRHPCSSDTPP